MPPASVETVLAASPAQRAFLRVAAGRLTVLAYHGVDDPARFEAQVRYLRRAMIPVSLADVAAAARGGGALPPRAVLVTFDDGHRSVLDAGASILAEHGVPAVAFVVAGLLDTDQPFWWTVVERLVAAGGRTGVYAGPPDPRAVVRALKRVPDADRLAAIEELRSSVPDAPAGATLQLRSHELAALESAGIAVANHTWSHPVLPQCDPGTVAAEIRSAHDRLAAVLGHHPRAFAYPNGDHDQRAEALLADLGYEVAFLFDHRANALPVRHPLRLSRARIDADDSLDRFKIVLSGLHPALHHLRGRP
jgi:peptidoglycan/xylan/chitin deacetylase (PgdA/CDA1 family)